MPTQQLNQVQRKLVNETVRPGIERLIALRYYLDGLVQELDNQQDAITVSADGLGDNADGSGHREDAPVLTGQDIQSLRDFAVGMRDQITPQALDVLTQKSVRDVNTVIRTLS